MGGAARYAPTAGTSSGIPRWKGRSIIGNRLRRLFGYFAFPLVGLVVPLLGLPAVTSRFGAAAWASIAVGQAAGAIAATAIELGWGWNGPIRVARAKSPLARQTHLALASGARLLAAAVVIPPMGLIAYISASEYRGEAALTATAAALLGLSTTWYFVGIGQPWVLLLVDGAPRLVGVSTATLLIAAGAPLVTYPAVGLLIPAVVAFMLGSRVGGLQIRSLSRFTLRRISRAIRSQLGVMTSRLLSSAYIALPVILMSAIAPVQQVAQYAAGDRITRMGLTALSPVPAALQSWVGRGSSRALRLHRAWRGVGVNAVMGVIAGAGVAFLLPAATDLILSGTSTVNSLDAILLGICVAEVCTSRAVGGLVLVVQANQRAYLVSTVIGASVGVVGVLSLGASWGATGAFLAIAVAEAGVLATQLLYAASRRLR